ncbi:MAG: UDP-N-acetylmuramoyl-L-alanyl-D-glutamate--2,6-diaminopimelate ligase [Bacillota bacterium]
MKLRELVSVLPKARVVGQLDVEVNGIAHDSRKVSPGELFVCVRGLKFDGHDFAEEAVAKGAVALVAQRQISTVPVPVVYTDETRLAMALVSERFFGFPSRKLRLVGVTGTKGKTTTAFMIKWLLEQVFGHASGLIGTVANLVGQRQLPVTHTTPESTELSWLLKEMVDSGCAYAAMEVSSHAIALRRIAGCSFHCGVFTNLTQDHLDFHRDMEDYFQVKAGFMLGQASFEGPSTAVVNQDDPYGARLIEQLTSRGKPVITYGLGVPARVRGYQVEVGLNGTRFRARFPNGQEVLVATRMTGRFNVYNALAAMAVAWAEGADPEKLVEAVSKFPGVPGRFERVDEGQPFTVVVDYAHTPASLENVLTTARELGPSRIITVFGCGGDRDKTKRPLMAEVVGRLSDYAIVTSDNPRSEDPEDIIRQTVAGFPEGARARYEAVVDRAKAIRRAIGMAQPGDFVLIAGKGHETYQVFGDKVVPFDDREVARGAIRALRA